LSTAVQKTVYSGQILRFHVSRCSPMFAPITVSATVKSARNTGNFLTLFPPSIFHCGYVLTPSDAPISH
jgi:hypothetical protein